MFVFTTLPSFFNFVAVDMARNDPGFPYAAPAHAYSTHQMDPLYLEQRYSQYMAQHGNPISFADSSITDVSLPLNGEGSALNDPVKRKLLDLVKEESHQLKAAKEAYHSKKQVIQELRTLLEKSGHHAKWVSVLCMHFFIPFL